MINNKVVQNIYLNKKYILKRLYKLLRLYKAKIKIKSNNLQIYKYQL